MEEEQNFLTLELGSMPKDADPASTIAAGPWCFVGQEDFFPDWEKHYRLAPEPVTTDTGLEQAVKTAQAMCVDNIPTVARHICPYADKLPPIYWQTLLVPWLINVCRQIVERHLRVLAMIRAYGSMHLEVPVLPFTQEFKFEDEQDFTLRGSLGIEFNHWLFSRLLEPVWPKTWQKIVLPNISHKEETGKKHDQKQILHKIAKRLLLGLFFPRLKGMSFFQALEFSLAINHSCHEPDHSLDLQIFASSQKDAEKLEIDPLPIFLAAMPESLKKLRHPASIEQSGRSRIRIAAISAYEDAAYRQKLALWHANGNRLGYVQHGGNYGQIAVSCDRELVEYSQDVFFTWGWKHHGASRGNFVPMPYPQLQNIADKWHYTGKDNLIFVGAEMPAYGYRLESRPNPLQTIAYREDKAVFFAELGENLQAKSHYKPYFDVPGTLQDASWLLPRFPHIRLFEGNLTAEILSCKLLVLDHHGTTMLEALAGNIPVILFWRPESWPLCPEARKLLAILSDAGIWFDAPEKAANKVKQVWGNILSWWNSTDVRKARSLYCMEQAMTVAGSANPFWIKVLKKL